MKKSLLLLCSLILFIPSYSFAFYDYHSIGLKVGGDYGLNYRINSESARNFWDITVGNELNLTINHYLNPIKEVTPYIGIGGGVDLSKDADFNLRVPFGILYKLPRENISFYGEIAGEVEDEDFNIPAAVGFNFHFH